MDKSQKIIQQVLKLLKIQ